MIAIDQFSLASGLNANMDKSHIYIAGITADEKLYIANETGFSLGELPFRYLGIPLSCKKLSIVQYMPLVDKIVARIKCWISRFLSYGGRLQMIKSVLFGMQTYWSQVFVLPKKIIKLVESTCRTFLWTGQSQLSKRALVAWEKICMPRSAGGLNVLDIFTWNKVAICKQLWDVAKKKDTMWVKWVYIYYLKHTGIEQAQIPQQANWIVRKIFSAKQWLHNTGSISSTLAPFVVNCKLMIKKIYKWFSPVHSKVPWKNLVCVQGPQMRHRFILWLALWGRLATADRLIKWNIQIPNVCYLCNDETETLNHLFFECSFSE